jgi:CBS domain-containing protein
MPIETTRGGGQLLTAGDLCTRTVVYTDPAMLIGEAARLMRTHHVGALPVVEERSPRQRIVVGMLTDRDIASAVVAADRDPHALRVGDLMSADVVTARETDSVLDLLEVMRRKRVRRVPVTGSQGELVGMVALDDLLAVVAEQMQALAAAVGAAQKHELGARPAGSA